jgi:hypothetical protein
MNYEWGPWIEHDGSGCPVRGQLAHFAYISKANPQTYTGCGKIQDDGTVIAIAQGGPSWLWRYGWCPIIRYRVRRPLVSEWLAETTSDLPVTEDA